MYNLRTCLILYLLARLKLGWVVGATFFPRSRNSRPAQTLFFPPRELGGGRQLPFLCFLHHVWILVKGPFWRKCFPYPICKQIFVTILFDGVEDVLRKVDELRLDGISPITEATKRNRFIKLQGVVFLF